MRKSKLILILAIAALGGCATGATASPSPSPLRSPFSSTSPAPSPSASPSPVAPLTLVGRQFVSVSVTENSAPRPLVAGTQIRLNFTDQDLSASAGCNTIGGRYRVEAGVLLVEATGMTEMGCDPARHAQDDWLAAFLGARPEVSLNGNDLVLSTPTTVVTLLDREVAEPDLGLVGPTWTVVSLISGDAVSSVPDGVNATLTFGDDGSVGFEGGCNSGGGRVTVGDGTLNFSDIVVTDAGCGGAAGQVEGQFLGLLSAGQVSYTIDSGSLVLQVGDRGLQFAGR